MASKFLYRVEVHPKPRGGEPWIGHFETERKAKHWGEMWNPDEYTVRLFRYEMTRWPRQHKRPEASSDAKEK